MEVVLTFVGGKLIGQERVFRDRAVCCLGRSGACDVCLPADDCTASRHHCVFGIHPPHVWVRDCRSRNGTYVNGQRVGAGPQAVDQPARDLQDGDEIRVGETVVQVRVRPAEGPPEEALAGRPGFVPHGREPHHCAECV
jgi:pSer/pThr/pTyr-binding forkhead associated (FHA) protein